MNATTANTACELCILAAYDHLGGRNNPDWDGVDAARIYNECVETALIHGADIDHFYACDAREDPYYDGPPCGCACNRS